jgi:mannose-1-phosphate guanylyltransferase
MNGMTSKRKKHRPKVGYIFAEEKVTLPEPIIAVVIPAGGGGTRLWPRSRQETPKQFLDVVSERTMLQETADRVRALVPPERLFVITNARHVAPVQEQLPEMPPANIIGEPMGRDSAPAIGLMATLLEKRLGPDAVMVVLPADHVIPNDAHFRAILRLAAEVAGDGWLVTLGIPPTGPDTGFGYIQSGEAIREADGLTVRQVQQFKEKPKQEVAEQYLHDGGYFWNAGMFIVTVRTLRGLYKSLLPQMEEGFAKIVAALGTDTQDTVLQEVFPTLEKISVDYAIAEKADKVAVIPADMGWNDVGSWARLAEVLAKSGHETENIVVGHHLGVDTTGTMIYSPKRLIATIGLTDMIVIDTPDATLICPKSRSEDVKKIVDALKAQGRNDLL